MRLFFALLVAALLLPNINTALAGSPDYAVTFLKTDLDVVVGQQAVPLDVEITNQGDPGYLPKFWIFLLDESGKLPVVNWNLRAEDNGAVGELTQGFPENGLPHRTLRGQTIYAVPLANFPLPKPGRYTLQFLVQPGIDGVPTCEECRDSNPSNNDGRLAINVRVPDLIITNAFITRPDAKHVDGAITFKIANIGDGIAKYGDSRLDVFLSPTSDIVGESFPNISEIIHSERFIGEPFSGDPSIVAIPPGESVNYTFPIPGWEFSDGLNGNSSQTFFAAVRIGRSQDIRLGGTYGGLLVEARTDNNLLAIPIHVTRPKITRPPSSQSKRLGSTVVFGAEASDFNSFQWLFNETPIPGETNATLTLPDIQATAAGKYSVVVSNEIGSVASDPAVLTVELPPTVTQPPISQVVVPGSSITLTLNATGDAPFTYQWRRNSQDIPGATSATYTFNATEAGQFTVVVANAVGRAESTPATVSLFSVETFAGTVLAGPPGGTYRIEFREALDAPDAWKTATTVTLAVSPIVWVDQTSPKQAHRFYRAVPLP